MSSKSGTSGRTVAIVGLVLIVLSGIIFWSMMDQDRTTNALRERGVQTTAEVTTVDTPQSGNYDTDRTVHITFPDQNGRPVQAEFLVDESKKLHRGDRIPIVYDPQAPTHATGNLPLGSGPKLPVWLAAVVGIGGLALALRGLFMAWSDR